MKLPVPNKIEWASFITLMPLISFLTCFVLFGNNWYHNDALWFKGFGFILLVGLGIWYTDVVLTRYIHDTFISYRDTIKRIVTLVVKQFVVVTICVFITLWGVENFSTEPFEVTPRKFWLSLFIGVGITLIAMIIWEGDFIFKQYKESVREREMYAQLSLEGEFESLKRQVNPHFLFNCFNTLSALISEDKQKAERFLNELSKVYRYLLRTNESGMSTLRNELYFIESYMRLLKTRHGEALRLQIETDKKYDQHLLPTLSLQMLVENVVKHNALSKNHPLTIEIFTTAGNKLVVNNNIRGRSKKAPSGRVGLSNIATKYELLNQPGFQVMEDGKYFTVVLPLIWNGAPTLNTTFT